MKQLVCIITLSLLPLAALAAPEKLDLKYEASWNGIKAGTAEVSINETADSYSDKVRADAQGIVKNFTNYWTDNIVNGEITGDKYHPALFDSKWQPKKAPVQDVVVTYGKDGSVNEVASPPENRNKRPLVSAKDKQGLPDPITAAMMARHKIRDIIQSGVKLPEDFTIRTFDSRRVTDLNFVIVGYETVRPDGQPRKLLKVTFSRTPVAGYNAKELMLHNTMNPIINIYGDENYIPVYAVGQAVIGQVEIRLIK